VAELNGTEHSAEMARGEHSQFDVFADDRLIFSKQREGRYPDAAEILQLLA